MKPLSIGSLFLLIIFLSSCEKEEDINFTSLAEDLSIAQYVSDDVKAASESESKTGDYSGTVGKAGSITYPSTMAECAVITADLNSGNFPMVITVDYGSGCEVTPGLTRKGKLTILFSGPYSEEGSVLTVTPTNYHVNGYKYDGIQIIRNVGRDTTGVLAFEVTDSNGIITKPNGEEITWFSKRRSRWIEGESTGGFFGYFDDKYSTSGYAEGVSSDGYNFRFEDKAPLITTTICYWVTQGVLAFSVNGDEIGTIDYGNGTCDANGTLEAEYQGKSYTVNF